MNFCVSPLPKTCFGPGSIRKLPDIVKQYGARDILLITGRSSFQTAAYSKDVHEQLVASGVRIHTAKIEGEPSPERVDDICLSFSTHQIGLVIAIGGGSVMDAGKAVSAMLPLGESVADYLEGVGDKTHPGCKIPMVAVPTTSGTGSEATKNAVLSKVGEHGYKRSLRHDNFMPDHALIDPELTLSCPGDITAASGMDALNQLLEAYLSVKANPYTDSLALSGIEAVFDSLERLVSGEGGNLALREKMAYASFVSGIVLAHAGLGIVHGLASSVGGLIDIPHGVLCGKMNATVMAWVIRSILADQNLRVAYETKLHRLFMTCGIHDGELDAGAEAWIGRLGGMERKLALPGLSGYGLTHEYAKKAAALTSSKESPVKPSCEDLYRMLSDNL